MAEGSLAALVLDHPAPNEEPLLFSPRRTWTTGEARLAVAALRDTLEGLGVEAGNAVAVRAGDGAEIVIAMTAIWALEAVFVPVNHRMPEAEISVVMAESGAVAAVHSLERVERLDGTASHPPGTAFVLWTSGTTGRPKAVLHTHEAYLELLDRVLGPLGGASRDPDRSPMPNLIPVSMALNAGIYNALFGLRAGAPLVFMDRFEPHEFRTLVARHEIRSTVLPPAAMAMLVDEPDVDDLAPLRRVRSITAPLSPVLARRFKERFDVDVLNGYGQAEIGEVIGWTAADAREWPRKVGAIGRPHPGVDISIESADDNGVGELLVRPPNLAAGYASGDELGDRLTDDGFVRTGDLARVDADGFVWVEGRLGDVINRGGNKVFPEHVEEALRAAPGVVDAAVVPRYDERLGEVPVAFVVTDREVADADLEETCRSLLVAYKVPVAFHRVDEIPRTEVGKVMRQELAARA